jgi:hypothetical protein
MCLGGNVGLMKGRNIYCWELSIYIEYDDVDKQNLTFELIVVYYKCVDLIDII